jgi:hypothetical protein
MTAHHRLPACLPRGASQTCLLALIVLVLRIALFKRGVGSAYSLPRVA